MSRTTHYKALIRSLPFFKGRKIRLKRLKGGLTNISFIATNGPRSYVVRFAPRGYAALGINKPAEVENTTIAAKLHIGPRLHAFDAQNVVTIVDYLPGRPITKAALGKPKNIQRIAKVLRTLHTASEPFSGELNIYTFLKKSLTKAGRLTPQFFKKSNTLLKELREIEKKIGPLSPSVPCHLDLLLGNIIISGTKIKLIDWEYAAKADYRFDLANISVMGEFSPIQDTLFLTAYRAPLEDYRVLPYFKKLVHMRESVWALLQLGSKGDKPEPDSFYVRYANTHFKKTVV